MQVTVTENNDNEGESFSYIFNDANDSFVSNLMTILSAEIEEGFIEIEENTDYTEDLVKKLNKASKNTYMDRFGFYKIPVVSVESDIYSEVFYKAVGLDKI